MMSKLAKSSYHSVWTPLNNENLNKKVFEERCILTSKWFNKWSDNQKLTILKNLVSQCNYNHLEYIHSLLSKRKSFFNDDFTRCLPRIISIYIFIHLDPRSLSRCAQVCWHWKNITELDQLWIKRCLTLGWILPYKPLVNEVGAWKKFYIEKISSLKNNYKITIKNMYINDNLNENSYLHEKSTPLPSSTRSKRANNQKAPWKSATPTPKDIWRNNYLDNDAVDEKIDTLQRLGMNKNHIETIKRNFKSKKKLEKTNGNKDSPFLSLPFKIEKKDNVFHQGENNKSNDNFQLTMHNEINKDIHKVSNQIKQVKFDDTIDVNNSINSKGYASAKKLYFQKRTNRDPSSIQMFLNSANHINEI